MSSFCASKLRKAPFLGLCFAVLLAAGLPKKAEAQVLYGSVVGTVTDQSGAMLPGAQITVTNERTGLTRQATSDAGGSYRILDLPEGSYTLSVSAKGFKALKKTAIPVVIGQVNQQDLQLEVGAVTQEVTVQASAVALQTTKADVHTTIGTYAIDNLPLNIYRNFQTLELLAPGVFSDSTFRNEYPNSVADTPERSLAINSNGMSQHMNTTRVDGATNIFIWLPDHMLIVPPQETIQEVNVQTASFDVEKGLTAGAATDVVTKSGSNAVHGALYGYHTDQKIDAKNFVLNPHDSSFNPKHIINNDGVALGGPIKKNKLFFFANWDRLLESQTETPSPGRIPPLDFRKGDFSSTLGRPLFKCLGNDIDPVTKKCRSSLAPIMVTTTEGDAVQLRQGMVFDPATGNTSTGVGRSVFSSGGVLNVIPPSRLNQGALNFWQLLPPPNIPGPFTSSTTGNFFISKVFHLVRNIYTGKMDWNRTDKHAIWGKYTLQTSNFFEPFDYGDAGGAGTGPSHQFAQTMTIGHTWTKSASKVLTGHVGFTRMSEHAEPPGFGKPLGQTVLGIPGANEPTNDIRYSGLPAIAISGYAALGSINSWEPVTRNDWTLTISHNLTWVRSNHELRFGFDAAHNHLNHWQPEIVAGGPRGRIVTSGDNTFLNLPADPASPSFSNQLPVFTMDKTASGFGSNTIRQNSVAAFDLGYVSEVLKGEQFIKNTAKDWQYSAYFGDRWKATPKLTADLGVRWENYPILTRDGVDKLERYDPATNTLFLGGVGGNPKNLGVTTSKKLFAPRVGLAYRYNDKTVLRSGFGISNDTLPLERTLRGFYPLAIGEDDFVPSSPVSTFIPFGTFQQGIPLIQAPDISSGKLTPPPDVIVGTFAPGHFNRGYVESWNFFVERELPERFLLNVGYVGNHLVHELNGRLINAGTINGFAKSQPLAAFGRVSLDTFLFAGYLDSHYNSLQVSLKRHTYKGLYIQGSYTYSKAIGYINDSGSRNGLQFNCPPEPALPQGCQSLNRHTLSFDHTHILKMAYVYELPFGLGKKWANSNSVSRRVLGGWQINGIFSAWNGTPLFVTGPNRLGAPGTTNTPDIVAPVRYLGGHGPGQYWFDQSSFSPVLGATIGSMPWNPSWLRGPGLTQMDFSLFRHFKISERMRLEMRGEAQNLTNTPHYNNPGGGCSIVSTTTLCGGGLGQITGAYGNRIVQLGAKLTF